MLKRLVVAGAMVLIGLAGLGVVVALPQRKEESPPPQVIVPNVSVEVIQPLAVVPDRVVLPAVVEPYRVVRVAAEVPGRVERLLCEEGKPCEEGAPLVALNTDLLRAEHDQAHAEAVYAESEHARIEDLFRQDATSRKDLDLAAARLAVARAAEQAARARLDRAMIRAPVAGVVNRHLVKQGEYVQTGQVVMEIVDMDPAIVVVHVPEKDIQFLGTGAAVDVRAAVRGDRRLFVGRISLIEALADERARTTRTEVSVPNAEGLLRSGQIVEVELVRRLLHDVILVPLRAVIPLEEGKAVYVLDAQDRAERRDVALGLLRGDRVQVLSGLRAGERLVVEGHRYVSPGQSVQVVSAAPTPPDALVPSVPR